MTQGARRGRNEERLDAIFQALGDCTRRALLARLARSPARITDLAKPFAISLPAVSKHIRVLEQAGLVRRSVDGRVHQCTLDAQPLQDAASWLSYYRRFWDDNLAALAAYVGRH
jgi:DNA-binding transcriptional ArsR family regulator